MPQFTEEDLQNGIPANAPVVPIQDANTIVNPNRKLTSDELVQRFYQTREPAPVFDQGKADRLQRMGRINQIGQGVKVLGDILGSSLGANTRRRQPDTTAPALYQSYQNMLDKYEANKEAFNYRDFQTKRDNLRFGIGQANHEAQLEQAAKKQADWVKAKEADSKLNFAKWNADYDLKSKNLELQRQKAGTDANYKNAKLKIDQDKANLTQNKPFDPVQVKDKFGNSIKLDQGQWDALYQSAMRDSEFTNGNLKAEISKYKDLPDGGVKQIARAYHDYNQQKEYNANEKEALEKHRQEKTTTKKVPSFFQ